MRLELKDLQDAYDYKFGFPIYLLRYHYRSYCSTTIRFWNQQAYTDDDFETLAFAEVAE